MNLGVFVACTFGSIQNGTMEPTAPGNIEIRNCSFINCGHDFSWQKFGERAAICSDVGGREIPSIKDLRIINNTFRDQPHADIFIIDAIDVVIAGNRFNGRTPEKLSEFERNSSIRIDQATVRNLRMED